MNSTSRQLQDNQAQATGAGSEAYVVWFDQAGANDVVRVGGKNASLAEMTLALGPAGISVPPGFALTVAAYRDFLEYNQLVEPLATKMRDLEEGNLALEQAGAQMRRLILESEMPPRVVEAIVSAYAELGRRCGRTDVDVAVRSSGTAEDLPGASFAGQHESFLNVVGQDALAQACIRCFASLFKDRAIVYRQEKGFGHLKVGVSVGVQKMVRSDKGSAGVMFSIDTESGFPRTVVINAAYGLGESVVQGTVIPDQYVVFKPLLGDPRLSPIIDKTLGSKETRVVYATNGPETQTEPTPTALRASFVLSDDEILRLSRWAVAIEHHYGVPMDMEWAKDGGSGEIFLVQARPETVQSMQGQGMLKSYRLLGKGKKLLTGISIGEAIAAGPACVIQDAGDIAKFVPGSVLVTAVTSPDWVPIMKQAAAIVTDQGGRTSHAAIVSRELGIPAIVGTGSATREISQGRSVTVSCAEGDEGYVYDGLLEFEAVDLTVADMPAIQTQVLMNIADPASALRWWRLPCRGIGLARMEFIINNIIKVHPMALLQPDKVTDPDARKQIEALTAGYADKSEYFVDHLAWGIAKIAASRYPDPVIVRMSDFKTNEYANLLGGQAFEPVEENPMLGFRGASRYYSDRYRAGFALECRAVKRARQQIGLDNVIVMIPFCRTLEEADNVLAVMAEEGLRRGENGLEVYVMAEIPSNVILAEEFAARFDGFSIGSNDLTQLVLGIDRDSTELAHLFDERNLAVKRMISQLIATSHRAGAKVGICGQAPSDYPEFAAWLVSQGIDSMSLNPDTVVPAFRIIAAAEAELAAKQEVGR